MKIKIVAAIVDTRQLTLYREDGESIIIKQGDQRLRPILDQVTPQIVTRGFAELEITDITVVTGFQQFEGQSGLVRFFKVAREKLKDLFAPPVDAAAVGKVPAPERTPIQEKMDKMVPPPVVNTTQAAIDEVMRHAIPVSAEEFTTEGVNKQGNIVEDDGTTDQQRNEVVSSHTIVAQVGGKLIPDMERIENHFARAAKLGSPGGVEKFLQRLAAVIDQRTHSVEDLLKFMERADMPIADDGSVIIFKMLNRVGNGRYVDCHTGNVSQTVGSYVCMGISLVDRVRNNECSNGLHVGRRGYMRSFSGNVCTVAKLAPEDVVTVPTYDANKMRVMGYHILTELSAPLFELIKKNQPITDLDEGKVLLGKLLAGDHIGRTEEVRITSSMGGTVVITPITPAQAIIANINVGRVTRGVVPIPSSAEALANPEQEKQDTPINPKEVIKNVQSLTRKDQAQKLFKVYKKSPTQRNKDKLIAFKKSVKLGWKALGIDESQL